MGKVYLRIISFTLGVDCFQRIKQAFFTVFSDMQITDVTVSELKPYWKMEGYGEITIDFISYEALETIKAFLSDTWENAVTDSRWANIFCDDIAFIGVSVT